MSRRTQDNSLITLSDFSLGKDVFILSKFSGSEYLSETFQFDIDILSETLDIKATQVMGKPGYIAINNEGKRFIHGHVSRFARGEIVHDNLRAYRITLVPWLWFLSKTQGNRIFQNKTTKAIVSQVFDDLGFTDYEFKGCSGAPREYCVQYGESDLDFVSRLLQEDGITYYFKHSDSEHKLVLTDQLLGSEVLSQTDLEYSRGSNPNAQLNGWEHEYRFRKGQWTLTDYAFKTPKRDLLVNTSSTSDFDSNRQFEHYEYADIGLHDIPGASQRVKQRLEAEEVDRHLVNGSGICSSFFAGGSFAVAKHEAESAIGDYTLIEVSHYGHNRGYAAGEKSQEKDPDKEKEAAKYSNEFVAMPADIQYRPAKKLHKPRMQGPQSALVVGPSGEEIYVDEFGRIKVQFFWDREGEKNESSSCYVRVMQSWAGNQWGASFIPRIGHEVIVNFLDGDPDKPIVSGSVYNGWNKPPYSSKTQSGIKTRSTKEGSPQNYNELRFDDKKGAEQIYVHAEKNYDTQVENDQSLVVDHDRNKHIKNDENYMIDGDRAKVIKGNQSESIVKDKTTTVGGSHDETVSRNQSVNVGISQSTSVGAGQTVNVGAVQSVSVGGNRSVTVGNSLNESVSNDMSVSIGSDHRLSVGKEMKVTVGKDLNENVGGKYTENVEKEYILKAKKIQLTAENEISFKVGSASILMKKNGDITLKGKKINIKGSSDIILKGSKIKEN